MTKFRPTVSRLNKKYHTSGQLSEVEYFYKLSIDQELLIRRIINIWGHTPPIAKISNMVLDGNEALPILLRILRTGEYGDDDVETLLLVRKWYIFKTKKIKS